MAANRTWKVTGSFHKLSDSVVTVTAPNLVAGIRKGALTIKRLPSMKGKRLVAGSYVIHEVDREVVREPNVQLQLPGVAVRPEQEGGTPPSKDEPSEG